MDKTVYFTGSLPRKGEVPFGGGEVGNVRTIKMLTSFGYRVKTVRRYRSKAKESKWKRRVAYPFRTLINVIGWFFVLVFGRRKNSIAHVSGFYGVTIPIEVLQIFIAKFLGYKLIYEMRGGGATSYFENGSIKYKKQFKYCVNKADFIFSQGRENEHLLKQLCDTPIFYYPNCVQQGFYPKSNPLKPKNKINLLFYGRIESEKNPFLIVDATALLQKKFSNITLTILGNGQKDYLESVLAHMRTQLDDGSYQMLPGCEHNKLQEVLSDKHFYVFPTVQPREGQSNAVTEAMSFGIIPIASPQGFNRSTIGNERLIVNDLNAMAYADRIEEIIQNGEIEKYSQEMRQRFLNNYTETVVFEKARKEYERIFDEK